MIQCGGDKLIKKIKKVQELTNDRTCHIETQLPAKILRQSALKTAAAAKISAMAAQLQGKAPTTCRALGNILESSGAPFLSCFPQIEKIRFSTKPGCGDIEFWKEGQLDTIML